jgi:CRISPR system Cascade subunit CasB
MTMLELKQQADAAYAWWRGLQPHDIDGGPKLPGDRATLARLRHASSPFEAAAEPATIRLYEKLGFDRRDAGRQLGRVAVLAAILAHVRETTKERLARSLGPPPGGEASEAVYSALRLRRLLTAKGDEEILIGFRRVVAILGNTANVSNLAYQILNWDRDELGDRTRTIFAFDYHSAGDHAPAAELDAAQTNSSDKD